MKTNLVFTHLYGGEYLINLGTVIFRSLDLNVIGNEIDITDCDVTDLIADVSFEGYSKNGNWLSFRKKSTGIIEVTVTIRLIPKHWDEEISIETFFDGYEFLLMKEIAFKAKVIKKEINSDTSRLVYSLELCVQRVKDIYDLVEILENRISAEIWQTAESAKLFVAFINRLGYLPRNVSY